MARINLVIPFNIKDELKQYKIQWDNKTWYYEGDDMHKELEKYIEKIIEVKYEDKDIYKKLYSSMKYDKVRKTWTVSTEDYNKFLKK